MSWINSQNSNIVQVGQFNHDSIIKEAVPVYPGG